MHIHTGKDQLLFNVAHLDHLCKICKLINWLQVFFSSSPQYIKEVLHSDALENVEAPRSPMALLRTFLSPLISPILVHIREQTSTLHVSPASWHCAVLVFQLARSIVVQWRARKAPHNMKSVLRCSVMFQHQEEATALSAR